MPIRNQALRLSQGLRSKDYRGEACAALAYVKSTVRYVRDIRSAEVLHDPLTLMGFPGHLAGDFRPCPEARAGDCDDMAILLSALLESIGHQTRFRAVAYQREQFAHVWVQDRVGGAWLDLEATEPIACGSRVPRGVAEIVQDVSS